MWPDRVSNPGPLTYESGALPTGLHSPAEISEFKIGKTDSKTNILPVSDFCSDAFFFASSSAFSSSLCLLLISSCLCDLICSAISVL